MPLWALLGSSVDENRWQTPSRSGCPLEFHDHFHLDRRVARKASHTNGGARMSSGFTEHFHHEIGKSIHHKRWSPKPSAELTMPSTLTTRLTRSRLPSAVRIFVSMMRPACRAASLPCSTVRPLPSLPLPTHAGPAVRQE